MMPVVELVRLEENHDFGTFGVLKLNKEVFCVTLEPRDEENARDISSIPVQQYRCRRYSSRAYPDTFQVMDVPCRDNILFHAGNTIRNTAGCILLAEYYGKLRGDRAVLNSGKTFKAFMERLNNIQEFHLTIQEHY